VRAEALCRWGKGVCFDCVGYAVRLAAAMQLPQKQKAALIQTDAETPSPTPAQQLLLQLSVLNRIARIATEDTELRPMLQRIVDTLHMQFGWEFIACASVDVAQGTFVCEAVHSDMPTEICPGYSRPLGSGVVGEVAMTGRTMDIPDTRGHPNFVDTLGGTLSELCVPVRHQGRVLAVLNVESQRLNAFDGQRLLLETVADQIAGAVRLASTLAEALRLNHELREANATLQQLSQLDGLTGLANRRQFDCWLEESWQAAIMRAEPLALLLIDVDHFKAYNDNYGHLVGDDGLRRIAQSLSAACNAQGAMLARYGGEEFVVLLPAAGALTAGRLAQALCERIFKESIMHSGAPEGRLSISVGLAIATPGRFDASEQLLATADRALYAAKHQGRNRVVSD
jgi:diguanylate cyclase (GGDEF)-like protein